MGERRQVRPPSAPGKRDSTVRHVQPSQQGNRLPAQHHGTNCKISHLVALDQVRRRKPRRIGAARRRGPAHREFRSRRDQSGAAIGSDEAVRVRTDCLKQRASRYGKNAQRTLRGAGPERIGPVFSSNAVLKSQHTILVRHGHRHGLRRGRRCGPCVRLEDSLGGGWKLFDVVQERRDLPDLRVA